MNIERPTSNEKQTSSAEQGTPISLSSSFLIKRSTFDIQLFSDPSTIHPAQE